MTTKTFAFERQTLPEGIQVRRIDVATTAHSAFLFSPEGKLLRGGERLSLEKFNEVRREAGFEPIPLFHMEFEDYPVADMPALPEGFEDHSWHNDMCPSFEHGGRGIQLWCDFADRELREFPESARFGVRFTTGNGICDTLDDTFSFEAEEWSEVEAYLRDRADEDRRVIMASDDSRLAKIITEKAVELIALEVQKVLEVPSGDMASLFFHENEVARLNIAGTVAAYIAVERAAAEAEGEAA
jgi:hypothetical protein